MEPSSNLNLQSLRQFIKEQSLKAEIITWDKKIYGDAILYSWLKDDGGGTKSNTISWVSKYDNNNSATFSYTYSIPRKNYGLGKSIVEYCDATNGYGYTYNTGSMHFRVNQQ